MDKIQQLKDLLTKKADLGKLVGRENDDFVVDDYACGDVDDAYETGMIHGEIFLAREILGLLE